jgi:hypothetical protein
MNVAAINPASSATLPDLETRVASRKQELISEILEHEKNSSRARAAEAIDKIKARLSELAHIVNADVVDGWANVRPSAKLKLDQWIARVIQDVEVARHEAQAKEADRDKAAFDRRLGSQCHDQRRFCSPAVTRAFTIRASSLGSQSEVSQPDEVTLHDSDASDTGSVRGVD